MENQNSNVIENANVENAKVSTDAKKKVSAKKSASKKESSTDAINLDKIKIDVSKGKKDLLTKERSISAKKDLYKSTDGMGEIDAKKFRNKLRRELHKFVSDILGKDRNAEERTESVKKFLAFYKHHWKVQNFKMEDFTRTNNPTDKKDYQDLLKYVQSVLK